MYVYFKYKLKNALYIIIYYYILLGRLFHSIYEQNKNNPLSVLFIAQLCSTIIIHR